VPNKDLVKKDIGNVFTAQPKEFNDSLNLEEPALSDFGRRLRLGELFGQFISPIAEGCATKAGVLDLGDTGQYSMIFPAVRVVLHPRSPSARSSGTPPTATTRRAACTTCLVASMTR
jgi:hypothetical protein